MSDAEKDALRDVLHAYDRAISDFEDNHTVIFPSESDRLRLFYASQKRWFKQSSTPGRCMHDRCCATSISRSHTIPMSASIQEIAETGHVVTPSFGEKGVEVVPMGIREASTFPGFCESHEAQFADFESQKQLTTPDHFYLQAFRTLCREIYTQRHHKQKLGVSLDDYRKLRDAFITSRLKQVQGAKSIEIKGVTLENDALENRVIDQMETLSENLTELDCLYHGVLDDLRNGANKISMTVAVLDLQLPVCLSGFGVLPYQEGGVAKHAVCFLAIIPEATETKIIMGGAKEHEKALTTYLQDESSPALLERLESWMCHGSDHWFMTRSAWDAIPQVRKDAICERILDLSRSIADPVGFSVLDGPRNHILVIAEAQLRDGKIAPGDLDDVRKLIAEEKAKLS